MGCGGRDKPPPRMERKTTAAGVTEGMLHLKKESNPSYELRRVEKVLKDDVRPEEHAGDKRAFVEGLIVQDILDQWKLKERTVRSRIQGRRQEATRPSAIMDRPSVAESPWQSQDLSRLPDALEMD